MRGRKNPEAIAEGYLLENSQFKTLPIEISRILENFGIPYEETDLPEDVSGVLNISDGKYSILVNKDHHENRKRFTLAHELGHYVLHKPTSIHVDKMSFYRSPLSSTALDRQEVEANRFAAAILMPKDLVERKLHEIVKDRGISAFFETPEGEENPIHQLASAFKVSPMAMTLRLQNLEIIDGF